MSDGKPVDDLTTLAPQAALDPDEHGVPELVHLVPAGRFVGRDGRGPYELAAPLVVIQQTRRLGMDLPIDRDHATDFAPKGTPVPAAGWITELQARADGIWGKVRWTPDAQAQIRDGLYRYLSPVVRYDPKSGAIVQLVRASLTNNPNWPLQAVASQERSMDQLLKAVAATFGLGEDADEAKVVAHAEALARAATERATRLGEIASALGLDAQADADAIAAKAKELAATTGRAEPDPGKFVPMTQFQVVADQLAALQAERAAEKAAAAVDGAARAGKVAPPMREWALAYASRDPEGFAAWAKAAPAIVEPGRDPRTEGPPPEDAGKLSAAELEVASRMGLDLEEVEKVKKTLSKGRTA